MSGTVLRGSAHQPVTGAETEEDVVLARLARIGQRLDVNVDQLLQVLEDVTDSVPPGVNEAGAQLSEHDEATLHEAGLLRRSSAQGRSPAPVLAAVHYTELLADSLSVKETAAQLGVTEGRVRQRLADVSLYGVQSKQGWRLPQFQFGLDERSRLPGLELVLRAMPSNLHPLSVEGFFTRTNVDLATEGRPMSVAEWLAAGGDPAIVVELAHDVLLTA